jgi:ComEC/Rec2-related protein
MRKIALKNAETRQLILVVSLLIILLVRFIFELRLSSQFQTGQGVKLNFCLTNEPYYYTNSQIFYYQNHFQKIKIRTNLEKKYSFGDCLQISGKIEACSEASKIKYCLLNPVISTYRQPLRISVLEKLRRVREKLADIYFQSLPYPYADLSVGVVLGVKKNLDPLFYEQLRRTGTLHIIVASGYNLTVSAQKPTDYLSYLIGRRASLVAGIIFIWFYVSLVGWQPPIIRAGLVLTCVFIAQLFGRRFYQWRTLVFTVWLMLIFKPDLIVDPSFQLSFTALLGLMLGGGIFGRLKKIPLVGSDLAETLSAQLLVAPIISYHFGRLSVLSPLVNGLVLPFIPKITWGGISALLGLFWPLLGRLLLIFIFPLIWVPVQLIEWFGRFSWTEIGFSLPFWGVIAYYFLVFIVFHIVSTRGKMKNNRKNQIKLFQNY